MVFQRRRGAYYAPQHQHRAKQGLAFTSHKVPPFSGFYMNNGHEPLMSMPGYSNNNDRGLTGLGFL